MTKKKKHDFDIEDYIKTHKSLSRLEELERNGGRWVAKDRPHKNKKKYNRKRDRRIDFDYPFSFIFNKKNLFLYNFINCILTINHFNYFISFWNKIHYRIFTFTC